MVVINNKFVKYNELGEKIAEKICRGYKVTVVLTDVFWNGYFMFEHKDCTTAIVEFKEFNANDEVVVRFNSLGEIVKEF